RTVLSDILYVSASFFSVGIRFPPSSSPDSIRRRRSSAICLCSDSAITDSLLVCARSPYLSGNIDLIPMTSNTGMTRMTCLSLAQPHSFKPPIGHRVRERGTALVVVGNVPSVPHIRQFVGLSAPWARQSTPQWLRLSYGQSTAYVHDLVTEQPIGLTR